MNKYKKEVYDMVMCFWSALKDYILIENPDYDAYVDAINKKWHEVQQDDFFVRQLFVDLSSAFCKYVEARERE